MINYYLKINGQIRKLYYRFLNFKSIKEYKNILVKSNENYVVFHNPNWLGITNSTKNIFKNTVGITELYSTKLRKIIVNYILKSNYKTVIFSGFCDGWINIIKDIKKENSKIKIKVIWHGSNALITETEDWNMYKLVLEMYQSKMVNQIVFVKKTMYDFYKEKGYNTYFLMNNVNIENKEQFKNKKENDKIKLGLYSSGNRWVKNTYNQLSAISLVENSELDCVAFDKKISEFCKMHDIKLKGSSSFLKQNELFKRMASNDVNVYATFTECAPMLPLESFELGVPCVSSNNHHYFKGTELEYFTVVTEPDNIKNIYDKIMLCLENKEKIMKLYRLWKKEYNIIVEKNIKEFLEQE